MDDKFWNWWTGNNSSNPFDDFLSSFSHPYKTGDDYNPYRYNPKDYRRRPSIVRTLAELNLMIRSLFNNTLSKESIISESVETTDDGINLDLIIEKEIDGEVRQYHVVVKPVVEKDDSEDDSDDSSETTDYFKP
jgi:hypothetical protein